MKIKLSLFVLCISFAAVAQITIKGTVYKTDGVFEDVVIYINNSTLGTTTNAKGEFELELQNGNYELIVSYLGYKKINYSLNTATYKDPLVFALIEDEEVLDEIVIKKTVFDDEWKHNVTVFKQEFIGKTALAADCEITNPEVLFFDYNPKDNILTAYARKPLQLKHKSLGYVITYELENFKRNKNYITFLGYARYEQLKGGKRKQKRWKENRLKAYYGSFTHFYQTLLKNTTYEEGFLVHLFKRVPNPERPSEEEIIKARQIIQLNSSLTVSPSKVVDPKTTLDSALVTLSKVRLPKFKDNIYKTNAPISDIISKKNHITSLDFTDNILVVYTKEKEEKGYILRNIFSKMREAYPQSSSVIPLELPVTIDVNGLLVNPLSVYYEGYWSYEKFANSLPLDYVPEN